MRTTLFILSSLLSFSAFAQSGFQRLFSDPIEYQRFAYSAFDSTFIIAGSHYTPGQGYDLCAAKLDGNGSILWSKVFAAAGDDYLASIFVSASGQLLLSGYGSDSLGNNNYTMLRVQSSGSVLWCNSYGTSGMEAAVFAGENTSGEIFLTGNREMTERPGTVKTNNSGTILWSKTYGNASGSQNVAMASTTKDGGLVLMGWLPVQNIFLMKTAANGTTAWNNSYSSQHHQFLSSLRSTNDGGFIAASSDYRCDASGCHAYFTFFKLDSVGNVTWAKAVEGFLGKGRSGIETSDGGFVFTGQVQDSSGGYNPVLIKTDGSGNLLWANAYTNYGWYGEGYQVEETADGGYALFGMAGSLAYLVKTDVNGSSGCYEKPLSVTLSNMAFAKTSPVVFAEVAGADATSSLSCFETPYALDDSTICQALAVNEPIAPSDFIFYPNPFSDVLTLQVNNLSLQNVNLVFLLRDVFGRVLIKTEISNNIPFHLSQKLSGGIYFYEVYSSGKLFGKGKLVAR